MPSDRFALERLRRDPGLGLLLVAVVLVVAVYSGTLGRGTVNYDDPWLLRENWIVLDPSLTSLRAIWLDTSQEVRAVLGAEYLPVRDLSVMFDAAVWGGSYAGYHLTNLALYLAALALWFCVLVSFGIDRTLSGLTILIWALHPTHAESVAWLSERKGVLALALAGVSALGYARFRLGASRLWLMLAIVAAAAAVWSKALGAFSIAALVAFELVLPELRASSRRVIVGLAAIASASAAAFVPVLLVASKMSVVSAGAPDASAGWLSTVLGVHGFYLRLGTMSIPNAVSYPISTDGPVTLDIVLGGVGFAGLVALAGLPRIHRWRPPPVLRLGALIWLIGYFPASRIVLPVRLVVAADRYLLFPTLGLALIAAVAILAVPRRATAAALGASIVLAGTLRTLDAQASWRDSHALWARAVESNPRDGTAWSMYAEALIDANALDAADQVIERGLAKTSSPRLMLRRALLLAQRGDRAGSEAWMRRAAEAGEPIAMTNLALMLAPADPEASLEWARRAVRTAPLYANGFRILGKLALERRLHDEAYEAFVRAYALEPARLLNRFNLALALIALGRTAEAREHLRAAAADPALAARVHAELVRLP